MSVYNFFGISVFTPSVNEHKHALWSLTNTTAAPPPLLRFHLPLVFLLIWILPVFLLVLPSSEILLQMWHLDLNQLDSQSNSDLSQG